MTPPAAGRPWQVDFRGQRYRGEVIVADAFDQQYGEPVGIDLDFRLVFFTVPRRIARDHIKDRRIAMASPARAADASRRSLAAELRAIRETRARYKAEGPTGPSSSSSLDGSMAEREDQLAAQVAVRDAAAYTEGRIYTGDERTIDAREVFMDQDFGAWSDRLAMAVLDRVAPQPHFDTSGLPEVVTADRLASLHRELCDGRGFDTPMLESYGPGLGLVAGTGGRTPALDLVHGYVGGRGGEASATDLVRMLGEEYCVSSDLAALYLLAFALLRKGEIRLTENHQVLTGTGERLPGDRISWDLVGEMAFEEGIARGFRSVSATASESPQSALPYLRVLADRQPGGRPGGQPDERENHEWPTVAAMLERLGLQAGLARTVVLGLSKGTDHGRMVVAIDGLASLSAATDPVELVQAARRHFGSPSALEDALGIAAGLAELAPLVDTIVESRSYLAEMSLSQGSDMGMERDALLARIDADQLAAQPSLWRVIEDRIARLRADYAAAYALHHASYHLRAAELRYRLAALTPRVAAIDRLNRAPELGKPIAVDLPEEFQRVLGALKLCPGPTESDPRSESQPDLDAAPRCARCGLEMGDEPPDGDSIIHQVDAAMAEHGRRLASLAAGRVLDQPDKPGLAKFLELVQAGDAGSIANLLDEDVMAFLREFAGSEPT